MHVLGTHSVTSSLQNPIFLNWDLSFSYLSYLTSSGSSGSPVFTRRDCIFKILSSLKITNGSRKEQDRDLRKSNCMPADGCLNFLRMAVMSQVSWLSTPESKKIKMNPWKGPLVEGLNPWLCRRMTWSI